MKVTRVLLTLGLILILAVALSPLLTKEARAQLATSPWPMFRHDPQHTGRSPYTGPETPALKWSYTTDNYVLSSSSSSAAIGADGTVYIGSWDKLYALNPDGTLKWSYTIGGYISSSLEYVESSAAIAADGTVYVGSRDNKLYAINPGGTLKWSYSTGGDVDSSPAIGADGTVYVGSRDNKLYAIGSNQAPNQPGNTSPANGATGVSLTPTLQSSAFSDPDVGNTHAASRWQVTTTSGNYFSPVYDSGTDGSNKTQITAGNLTCSTTYYWKVRHQDNNGAWSSWSAETSFTAVSGQGAEQLPFGLPLWAWIAIGAGVVLIVGLAIGRLARR